MASETLVQVECAEACYWIASLMNKILHNDIRKQPLPAIKCKTDSRQLHEAILSIQLIFDKRLRIDTALPQQMILKKGNLKIKLD